MLFSKDDLEGFLKKAWAERSVELADGMRMGVLIEDIVAESGRRAANKNLPTLELWILLLDEFNSWLISLWTITWDHLHNSKEKTDFNRATWMLLSKIIGDTMAIRHLIMLGYDTAAASILRSVSEYIDLYVAIMDDPKLASPFVAADTPESTQKFWREYLRGDKLSKRVDRAWKNFGGGEHDEALQWMAQWGRSARRQMSGLAHPSVMGGLFTAIPLQSTYDNDEPWSGVLGEKSEMSVNTIFDYSKFLLQILLLHPNFPFDKGRNDHMFVEYDEVNELHKHIKFGRQILSSLILFIGREGNEKMFFPELDYSIFPED